MSPDVETCTRQHLEILHISLLLLFTISTLSRENIICIEVRDICSWIREVTKLPFFAKMTPNVTDIARFEDKVAL